MIKVSAPGKIHLSGEHSVVYGKPALLTAIDKRCFISIGERNDEQIRIIDKKFKAKETLNFNEIRHCTYWYKETWKEKKPLALVKFAINEIYSNLQKKPEKGFGLEIDSQIPIGCGLGSSAALAVVLTTGVLSYEGLCSFCPPRGVKGCQALTPRGGQLINKISFEIEKRQHGNPSGGDNTVVCFGGFLKFKKVNNEFQFNQLKFHKKNLPEFLLIDSGRPLESTGEMIAVVKQQITNHKSQITKTVRKMGEVTEKIIESFNKEDFSQLKYLISENERLLEELGVVGGKAKKIIQLIKQIGGGAKICGAGGIKEASGMILACHSQQEKLIEFCKNNSLKFMKIKLNQEGVRIEKN